MTIIPHTITPKELADATGWGERFVRETDKFAKIGSMKKPPLTASEEAAIIDRLFQREGDPDPAPWGKAAEKNERAIYFIAVRGFIKIGWSIDWKSRLSSLQVANPEPLEVLLVLGRPKIFEKTMHRQFAAYRKSGEWFHDHPEIRAYIESRRHECWYRAGRKL